MWWSCIIWKSVSLYINTSLFPLMILWYNPPSFNLRMPLFCIFFSQVGWSAVTVESSPIFSSGCYSDLGHHLFPVCCLIENIGTFMMGDSQCHRAITMISSLLLQNPPATALRICLLWISGYENLATGPLVATLSMVCVRDGVSA